jgi:hypothetical protein
MSESGKNFPVSTHPMTILLPTKRLALQRFLQNEQKAVTNNDRAGSICLIKCRKFRWKLLTDYLPASPMGVLGKRVANEGH